MAPAETRCPRCGFSAADVWCEELLPDRRVRRVVCRSCAFVFALTEPPDASPYRFALVQSDDERTGPQMDPLFARAEASITASRAEQEKLTKHIEHFTTIRRSRRREQ